MSAGEQSAQELTLGAVYGEHASFVWRVLLRLGAAPDVAEDLLHEVFLVVRRRLTDFDRTRSLRAWLHGIARGVAANHRRGHNRTAQREQALTQMPPSAPPTPEEGLARQEAATLVAAFLNDLDEPRRQVFALMDIEGMSGPEVAEALQLPLIQVYTRLRSARSLFRAAVAGRCAATATATKESA